MENKEKKVLNEEQLDVANGGSLFKNRVATNDDELDSVCGGAANEATLCITEYRGNHREQCPQRRKSTFFPN